MTYQELTKLQHIVASSNTLIESLEREVMMKNSMIANYENSNQKEKGVDESTIL